MFRTDQRIVCIFAHPDDDLVVAGLMARCAHENVHARILYATSGDQGVRDFSEYDAGPELAAERECEAQRACTAYGIQPPVFLRASDGLLADLSAEQAADLKQKIIATVSSEAATDIITFGPEGYTEHSDHKFLHQLATKAFEARELGTCQRLHYVGIPPEDYDQVPGPMRFCRPAQALPLDTVIDCNTHLEAIRNAIQAYKTQFSQEEMAAALSLFSSALHGRIALHTRHKS